MKIVCGILILFVIVISHEFGHFLIARMNKIEVYEFSIGFGPKIIGFKRGSTLITWRLIPFGGACIFDDPEKLESEEDLWDSSFRKASVWSRIATTVAGPFFNFLLAFILGLFVMNYAYVPSAKIVEVAPGSPAYEAGMQAGDKICKINGSNVYLYPEVSMAIQTGVGSPLEVVFEHDGVKKKVSVIPRMNDEYGYYMIGVTFGDATEKEQKSSVSIIADSYHYVRYMIKMTFASLKMLFTGGAGIKDMSGPVGVVSMVGDEYEAAKEISYLAVVVSMLNIALLLSANLGVINLLPLPALDGGKLLFLLIEAVRGKPVDPKKEGLIHFIGIALLLILMVVVMYNDIAKLFH